MTDTEPLVRVEGLTKTYTVSNGWVSRTQVHAVAGVDLSIRKGEVLALVGGSGSGKSTLGRIIVRLTRASSGKVWFSGEEINSLRGRKLREFRRNVGIAFQNPYRSLNPRMTVGDTIAEPLKYWKIVPRQGVSDEVGRLLELVGLPESYTSRLPQALSGGERQRIAIARALSTRPEFIVADEAVSSLDVSAAAEVLNLMMDLRRDLGLTAMFVTHDLNVARIIADRVAVMSQGKIVELAEPADLFTSPQHEYTKLLLESNVRLPEEAGEVQA